MGKVISLKLTKKEERIITRLNQEGITNSDLLRSALWHYFKPMDHTTYLRENYLFHDKDKISDDLLYSLKREISLLRENHDKIQEDFSQELDRLREHLYHGTPVIESTTIKELTPREQYVFDIHKNIDEILSKKEK